MSLNNIPILWKVVALLVVLDAAAAGTGRSAIANLKSMASQYDKLIKGPEDAPVTLARANRMVTLLSRAIYITLTSTTPEQNAYAEREQKNAFAEARANFAMARENAPLFAQQINATEAAFVQLV